MTGSLLGIVLRGVRARRLLSAGSVTLSVLALAGAVLGPIFALVVTNSYLISRLNQSPATLTGLTWTFRPAAGFVGGPMAGLRRATELAATARGPFVPPTGQLETVRVPGLGGEAMLLARPDACAHLEVTGACPRLPGEALLADADLAYTDLQIGDRVALEGLPTVLIVGSYSVPEDQAGYWFDPSRLVGHAPRAGPPEVPYQPAPLVVAESAFESVPSGAWLVRMDRPLQLEPDATPADLAQAVRTATAAGRGPQQLPDGVWDGSSLNDLPALAGEIRNEQDTARGSIGPGVVSLVLVALALLLRLTLAAGEQRSTELALAALRGASTRQLWLLGMAEPVALTLLAVPLGAALGYAAAVLLARLWLLPGLPVPVPPASVLAGLTVALAALAVAAVAVSVTLRGTLAGQLEGVRRPQRRSRAVLVAELTLAAVTTAIVVVKLSGSDDVRPDATDPLLPILLALVAGLAATQLIGGAARRFTARPQARIAGFVASRTLARRTESTLVVLPLTAALAVGVFAVGVYDAAREWRASVAATVAPAEVVWASPLPLSRTVRLTHDLDPDGAYLMAAAQVPRLGVPMVAVDSPRLAAVTEWPAAWTPGLDATEVTERLRPRGQIPTLTGRRLSLRVTNELDSDQEVYVEVRLDDGGPRTRRVYLGPYPPGTATRSALISGCRQGCGWVGLAVGGPAALPARMLGEITLSLARVDGRPVQVDWPGTVWSAAEHSDPVTTEIAPDTTGLRLVLDTAGQRSVARLTAAGVSGRRPVAVGETAGLDAEEGDGALGQLPLRPVLTSRSLPFLGPRGVMIDYAQLATDQGLFESEIDPMVLARAELPDELRDALRDRGFTVLTTRAHERQTLEQGAYALALRLYAVVAAACLLMALAGLLVSSAVQLPARRRDAAALRVVGVRRRAIIAAAAAESAVVLGGAAVAGTLAGLVAQWVVLRTVRLGYVTSLSTPRLIAEIDAAGLALVMVPTVLALGLIAWFGAVLTVRGARGATLRESAR